MYIYYILFLNTNKIYLMEQTKYIPKYR